MKLHFGLRAKLFSSSFLVLVLVLAFTGSGLFFLQETAKGTDDLYRVYTQGLQDLQTVSLNLYKANRRSSDLALSYVDNRKGIDFKAVGYELESALREVNSGFQQFQTNVSPEHRTEATQELVDQFNQDLGEWSQKIQKQRDSMGEKAAFEAVFYEAALFTLFEKMTAALDSLAVEMQVASQGAYESVRAWNDLASVLFLSFAGAILVLVLLVVYVQTRVIVRPILRVHRLLASIAAGDADLTKTLPVVTRDEVGQICANFNAFLNQLRTIVTRVQASTAETDAIAEALHADSVEVAASLGEINANNRGISANMDVLDTRLAEADASTTDLLKALDGLRLRVGEERRLVESSTQSIRGMIEGIGGVTEISRTKRQASAELVAVSRESGRQLEEASAAVGRINSAVDTILEMTQVVSAIAAQTNLLSMNAAIEAAHAGSAGAGFSVVADEIRKLATTSTGQSSDISKELKSIVGEIQTAWDLTHQAQSSYARLMDEVGGVDKALIDIMQRNETLQTLGGTILGSLEGLTQASHAVGMDMETIDRSTATVGATMTEVRRVSAEVSTGMQEIAQGTQDITMATQKGSTSNRQLVDQVQSVRAELGRFKVAEGPEATP